MCKDHDQCHHELAGGSSSSFASFASSTSKAIVLVVVDFSLSSSCCIFAPRHRLMKSVQCIFTLDSSERTKSTVCFEAPLQHAANETETNAGQVIVSLLVGADANETMRAR